jgi:hypothetical protein
VWERLHNIEPSLRNSSPTCQRQWWNCQTRQTRPLIREGTPNRQNRNCLPNKNPVVSRIRGFAPSLTGRLTSVVKRLARIAAGPRQHRVPQDSIWSWVQLGRNEETLCWRGPEEISSQPVPSLKKEPNFYTCACVWLNKNFGHGSRGDLKPGITLLARKSSNLTDQTIDPSSDHNEIYDGQIGTGTGFLRVTEFPIPIIIPQSDPHSNM